MTDWHTEQAAFLLDLLSFIEEQIRHGMDNPPDQFAAVDVALGAVPLIRERILGNDSQIATKFLLVASGHFEGANWQENWRDLAKDDTRSFRIKACKLLANVDALKAACNPPSS